MIGIYHAHCIDGFGSAMVLKRAMPQIELHPGIYGHEPPDVKDQNVYIVDFSYKREIIKEMLTTAASVTIIDHHKTAIEDLQGLSHPNLVKIFDQSMSGAGLTFKTFYPSEPVPAMIQHIQDRDLWKFELENTNEVCAFLYSLDFDINQWLAYNFWAKFVDDLVLQQGRALVRQRKKDITSALKRVPQMVTIGGWKIPCLNVQPSISSEVCQGLAHNFPFAASYSDTHNKRIFSLRSNKDGADVAYIADLYGGGGHKHAAGFSIDLESMGELKWTT